VLISTDHPIVAFSFKWYFLLVYFESCLIVCWLSKISPQCTFWNQDKPIKTRMLSTVNKLDDVREWEPHWLICKERGEKYFLPCCEVWIFGWTPIIHIRKTFTKDILCLDHDWRYTHIYYLKNGSGIWPSRIRCRKKD